MQRKRFGRPRDGERHSLGFKAWAASLRLIQGMTVDEVCALAGCARQTLYDWIGEVADSDHELAPAIRDRAQERGLSRRPLEVAG